MNETYQHPGKWHDILLIPTLTRSSGNHYVMSHVIRGLEGNSVYEAIVQAKNRYGWNEVNDFCYNCELGNRNSPAASIFRIPIDLQPVRAAV